MALASNPPLEALVREHDDEASWQVLEDWLLETNDPRAKLVRLEKAGEEIASTLDELAPLLLGGTRVIEAHEWRAGFARRAIVAVACAGADAGAGAGAGARLDAPALKLVRDLTLRIEADVSILGETAAPLESLTLEYGASATLDGAQLAPFARLERLRVTGAMVEIRDLAKASGLRRLELALTPRAVASVIAMNPLADVRSLSIATGTLLYPWHGVFDRLFDGKSAPKLEELHLDAAPASGNLDFLIDLAQSALGRRLKRLSLAGTECSPPTLRRLGRSIATLRDVAV